MKQTGCQNLNREIEYISTISWRGFISVDLLSLCDLAFIYSLVLKSCSSKGKRWNNKKQIPFLSLANRQFLKHSNDWNTPITSPVFSCLSHPFSFLKIAPSQVNHPSFDDKCRPSCCFREIVTAHSSNAESIDVFRDL